MDNEKLYVLQIADYEDGFIYFERSYKTETEMLKAKEAVEQFDVEWYRRLTEDDEELEHANYCEELENFLQSKNLYGVKVCSTTVYVR